MSATANPVHHRTIDLEGLEIFYREAGRRDGPTLLLLHGYPSSSHMFRDLIPRLADRYHVVAPDYPGFGNSSMPSRDEFEYSFDNLAQVMESFVEKLGLERYVLYVMDYGAPVGFRLATAHPERVAGLIVQNGNAYEEGIDNPFWDPLRDFWAERTSAKEEALAKVTTVELTRWQYEHGARDPELISPDAWRLDQAYLDRPGNREIQLELFFSYGTNPSRYPAWQAWMREAQPPTLITWGKNDEIFPAAGAHPYLRDLPDAELHLLDAGHFALEEDGEHIAGLIRDFLERRVS